MSEEIAVDEKVVVVTGASSGIGAVLAERLAEEGHAVVLVARREVLLHEVAQRCGDKALVAPADVTDREAVRGVVEEALRRFGHIDVWVNNAGRAITRQPSELTDEDIDEMVRQNVKSVLYGTQEVLPHFKARDRGHVVNVSSMLGRLPFATFRSAYVGAKHFVNALTACFRAEIQRDHPSIRFSLVSPGVVHTDFGLKALHGGPDSRSLDGGQSAEAVAEVIVGVITRPRPDVYTFPGAHGRVAEYYASLGEDPS